MVDGVPDTPLAGTGRLSGVRETRPVRPPADHTETVSAPPQRGAAAVSRGAPALTAGTGLPRFPSVERLLPSELLAHPVWRDVEWAWRRLLVADAGRVEHKDEAVRTAAVQRVWDEFTQLANIIEEAHSPAEGFATKSSQPVVTGREVPIEVWQRMPHEMRRLVLADRWVGAVSWDDGTRCGVGWFLPLPGTAPAQSADRVTPRDTSAVPPVLWRAERRSWSDHGEKAHHIRLSLALRRPVEIDVYARRPLVWIHLATDDRDLQDVVRGGQPLLAQALELLGWRLERLSVSDRDSREGNES